ncbi:hypothetical protein RCIP0075_00010 [Klebsiella phage RCIP0075]
MAVRRGEAPKRLRAEVTVKNAAERLLFKVVFVNMPTSAFMALAQSMPLPELLVQLIAEWDAEYPLSTEGFAELEDERPGCLEALVQAYVKTRTLEREGN